MPVVSVTMGNTVSRFTFTGEDTVRNILLHLSQPLPMPCGGTHSCGKCKVFCSGALSPMTSEEASFLTSSEIASGIRLACFVKAKGDFSIHLPEAEISTLSATLLPDHSLTGHGWGIAADLGTNGEIVLYHQGKLYCASTAMGPAFEGANLAFGMQALPGAISSRRPLLTPLEQTAIPPTLPLLPPRWLSAPPELSAVFPLIRRSFTAADLFFSRVKLYQNRQNRLRFHRAAPV